MIIEVAVARNHVGFNERLFTEMWLTDGFSTWKKKKLTKMFLMVTETHDRNTKSINCNSSFGRFILILAGTNLYSWQTKWVQLISVWRFMYWGSCRFKNETNRTSNVYCCSALLTLALDRNLKSWLIEWCYLGVWLVSCLYILCFIIRFELCA